MRKLIVFSKEDVECLMAICDPWSSVAEIIDVEVKVPSRVDRADEVILVTSKGRVIRPPFCGSKDLSPDFF
jgi:hypothetical protein